ncbi:hypothetical protein PCC6912_20720 [Chlorogloeopsis fritschii PCC 6912]|uniref:Uncharacterized protein n=1 Tax=Chlorogloeopsis fritschii PCC 6912 TaxID=211165 RepID=A0A433NLN8_CHLFR|nr:hypothetical protein PCC6912_20720 [Chlorogloeopsis fritschii PCC 6912]
MEESSKKIAIFDFIKSDIDIKQINCAIYSIYRNYTFTIFSKFMFALNEEGAR